MSCPREIEMSKFRVFTHSLEYICILFPSSATKYSPFLLFSFWESPALMQSTCLLWTDTNTLPDEGQSSVPT